MSADIRYRQRRYVVHMGIRTVCIILAVAVPMPLPLRVIMVVAAIAMPYFAVVLANGGREPEPPSDFDGYEPPAYENTSLPTRRREIES